MTALFVYGTLRAGQYNDESFGLSRTAKLVIPDCTARGTMRHVQDSIFPVFPVVNFDQAGTVRGDIIVNDNQELVRAIDRMETGAGYQRRTVNVTLPNGKVWQCRAYHYPHPAGSVVIPGGDWIRFASDLLTLCPAAIPSEPYADDDDSYGDDDCYYCGTPLREKEIRAGICWFCADGLEDDKD